MHLRPEYSHRPTSRVVNDATGNRFDQHEQLRMTSLRSIASSPQDRPSCRFTLAGPPNHQFWTENEQNKHLRASQNELVLEHQSSKRTAAKRIVSSDIRRVSLF